MHLLKREREGGKFLVSRRGSFCTDLPVPSSFNYDLFVRERKEGRKEERGGRVEKRVQIWLKNGIANEGTGFEILSSFRYRRPRVLLFVLPTPSAMLKSPP